MGTSRPSAFSSATIMVIARSESPPRSKKSSPPAASRSPRTSRHMCATRISTGSFSMSGPSGDCGHRVVAPRLHVRRDGSAHHELQFAKAVLRSGVVQLNIGDQSGAALAIRSREYCHVAHGQVRANCGFHTVEFHAHTADLYLPVLASDPFIEAVGPAPNQVAGPDYPNGIHLMASPRPGSQGDIGAANEQFAHLAL